MLDPTKTTLPKQWASEFAMALRSRDVTGAAIGDALREAEAYCADSGQAPLEAFGPAAAYADSLTDLPTAAAHTSWAARIARLRSVWPASPLPCRRSTPGERDAACNCRLADWSPCSSSRRR